MERKLSLFDAGLMVALLAVFVLLGAAAWMDHEGRATRVANGGHATYQGAPSESVPAKEADAPHAHPLPPAE